MKIDFFKIRNVNKIGRRNIEYYDNLIKKNSKLMTTID